RPAPDTGRPGTARPLSGRGSGRGLWVYCRTCVRFQEDRLPIASARGSLPPPRAGAPTTRQERPAAPAGWCFPEEAGLARHSPRAPRAGARDRTASVTPVRETRRWWPAREPAAERPAPARVHALRP